MGFRRVRGAAGWHEVDARLRAARSIWVVTGGGKGPHHAPVWFVWDGSRVVFSTGSRSLKARDLRADPRIRLHVGEGDDPILLSGRVAPSSTGECPGLEAAYGRKYVEPRTGEHASFATAGDLVVVVDVERISTWLHGDLSTRTEWVGDTGKSS